MEEIDIGEVPRCRPGSTERRRPEVDEALAKTLRAYTRRLPTADKIPAA
jgi:hypothetical protein